MTDREIVRQGYDDLGDAYDDQRSGPGPDGPVREFLETVDADRVLDAGCGPGTPGLYRTGASVVALDFSRGQLGLVADRTPCGRVQGDLASLPFENGVFDAVVASHSLIHVPDEDHRTALGEFARVLRPGGRALVSSGPGKWSGTNPDWLDDGVEMTWDIAGIDVTRERLRDAGFSVQRGWSTVDTLGDADGTKSFVSARLDQ